MADRDIALGATQVATGPGATGSRGDDGDRLAPGVKAGDYVVEQLLGAGAMGEVYAGVHPMIGKRVAIKVLKRSLASSAEAAERFVREARAVNQVDHPNVIDVFAFGRLDDGRLYLVMDLVEGRSLRSVLQDGPLDVPTALDVLAQIAQALDAAHHRGVVHRDLKPDNVMISGSPPKVHVLDFGIAKLVAAGADATGNGTLTGQGTWLGTPGYMAPEQWSADGAGPPSDLYALGVMAFELLAGKPPFEAKTLPQMMEQHFRAPVPALSARGAVPARSMFDPVLARAMAKDPERRFDSAADLVDALRAVGGKHGTRPVAGTRRRMWVPAAAGVAVLGASVAAVVAMRGRDERADGRPEVAGGPAPGFVRIDVLSTPPKATVMRGDRLFGTTPASFEVRTGEELELEIRKPGYASVQTTTAAEDGKVINVSLVQQNGFEGVWALPDGQLRAFARAGEQVDVFKLDALEGRRQFYRRFMFEDSGSPGGTDVLFVANETVIDNRAAHEPSCQVPVRVEYHYDPQRDVLDVRPEDVTTGIQMGRCVVHARAIGKPTILIRADRDATETRISRAPLGGVPVDLPTLTQAGDAQIDEANAKIRAQEEAAKREAADKPPTKPRPPARKKLPPVSKEAAFSKNPPPPAQNARPQNVKPQAQAPLNEPAAPSKNAQVEPQVNPMPQQAVPPRGDSQVAPQVQRKN